MPAKAVENVSENFSEPATVEIPPLILNIYARELARCAMDIDRLCRHMRPHRGQIVSQVRRARTLAMAAQLAESLLPRLDQFLTRAIQATGDLVDWGQRLAGRLREAALSPRLRDG